MKHSALISIAVVCFTFLGSIHAQTSDSAKNDESETRCRLQFNEHEWEFVHAQEGVHKCAAIDIVSLPDEDEDATDIVLNLSAKGRYQFVPDEQLAFAPGYHYLLEDQLTGMIYNLKTLQAVDFSFNRASSEPRFVLTIKRSVALQKEKPRASTLTAQK